MVVIYDYRPFFYDKTLIAVGFGLLPILLRLIICPESR